MQLKNGITEFLRKAKVVRVILDLRYPSDKKVVGGAGEIAKQ